MPPMYAVLITFFTSVSSVWAAATKPIAASNSVDKIFMLWVFDFKPNYRRNVAGNLLMFYKLHFDTVVAFAKCTILCIQRHGSTLTFCADSVRFHSLLDEVCLHHFGTCC